MQIQVHYQEGLNGTEWMTGFTLGRENKLNRYLDPSATAHVSVEEQNHLYGCKLSIRDKGQDFVFKGNGENYDEMMANTNEKARRTLNNRKQKIKDKINRRYVPLKEIAV